MRVWLAILIAAAPGLALASEEPKRDTFTTEVVIISAAVAILAYDVYAGMNDNPDDTISQVIGRAATRNPALPFAAGVLMGHLFWRW